MGLALGCGPTIGTASPLKAASQKNDGYLFPRLALKKAVALTFCPECSNQVSTFAASCPSCGMPLSVQQSVPQPAAPNQPLTIEQTSRSIKLGMVICAGAFWIGVIGLFAADENTKGVYAWMVLLGAIGWFFMKIARWWRNG